MIAHLGARVIGHRKATAALSWKLKVFRPYQFAARIAHHTGFQPTLEFVCGVADSPKWARAAIGNQSARVMKDGFHAI
ncbi:MAG: hypothetical protein ACLPWF_02310 [Bryobacteraceae bacterium]|jgi:hypothetical protein